MPTAIGIDACDTLHKRSIVLENNEMQNNRTGGHIFMFPARTPEFQGKKIAYLFSLRQVAEVLNHADTQPVPFAPAHTEGVAQWRGRILAVMSLERCLGIGISGEQMHQRSIVVRNVTRDAADNLQEVYTIINVGAAIRQLGLPLACEPTRVPDWVLDPSFLSGVYESDDGLLFVVNLGTILKPKRAGQRHVSYATMKQIIQ
ncbi:MAG: chemotaxis protein CheW [Desulfobacteraceae bacterium]